MRTRAHAERSAVWQWMTVYWEPTAQQQVDWDRLIEPSR